MKTQSIKITSQKGSSTLEMLIAFALLIIGIVAVILIVFGNQSVSVDTETNQEALYKAEQMIEQVRASSTQDFALVNPTATTTETSGSLTYSKKLDVGQIDLFTKQATTTITWKDESRPQKIELTTLLTNPDAVSGAGGGGAGATCSSVLSGNWKNPQHYDFWTPNLLPPPHANGIGISDLVVHDKRLYVTALSTPVPSPESFFIFDLPNNPSLSPILRGRIDNATTTQSGLGSVAVASSSANVYAYLANGYGPNFSSCSDMGGTNTACGQLQVVDVTDPTMPAALPISYTMKMTAVTGTGGQAAGLTVVHNDGIVYLGLAKTLSGPEFNMIDVGGGGLGGTPTHPVYMKGYSTGNAINAIAVKGDYAYIASPNSENITVLDVKLTASHPNITRVTGYTPAALPESNGAGSNHGKSLHALGNMIYLGRTYGTTEFYGFNNSTSSMSVYARQDVGTGNQKTIYGLAIRDYLTFMLTKDQFQVWDISNQSLLKPWTTTGTTAGFLSLSSFGGTGTALTCEGNTFYIGVASSAGNSKDYISVVTAGP